MDDPDIAAKAVTLLCLIVFGGFAAWWTGTWLRDLWRAARFDTKALYSEFDRLINATNEDNELRIDLLNLGFTEDDLQIHHMVVGHRGVYTIPRGYFVEQVRQAAHLHSRILLGLGGQRHSGQTQLTN
ncbi:hypothetical protein ACNUDN_30375 [Mycobacterium sp. smrl_JER01]|uniref:hypothetical protein n=1 Tax=Mycobacterium sp. smrl_JER01 TaxID=3402633 RepID=UPI003AC24386